MSEPERGPLPLDEICQHIAALTQAVKNLQEGYTQLESHIQVMPASEPSTATTSAASAPSPVQASASAPLIVMMFPPKSRVSVPERFSSDWQRMSAILCVAALHILTGSYKSGICYFSPTRRTSDMGSLPPGERGHRADYSQHFFQYQSSASAEAALHSLQQGCRAVKDYRIQMLER